MSRRVFACVSLVMLLAAAAGAEMPEDYLDVLVARVKPERRADFDAVGKKVAEANRLNKGDTWVAMETTYGENNTVYFISTRRNYADIETGSGAFMAALNKAYTEAGAQKLLQDFNNTIVSSRSEMRRRRWDLTANPPADAAAMTKIVGEARWVHTIIVHVRPGQEPTFEAMVRDINAAAKKRNEPNSPLISQSDVGREGGTYFISWLMKSLGDVDKLTPLPKILGEEGFQKFLKDETGSVLSGESVINRFLPELSNPPEQVAAAAPEFWNPKSKAAQ